MHSVAEIRTYHLHMLLRLLLFFWCAALLNAAPEPQFLNRSVTVDGVAYRYVVSIPAGWSADRTWPVVLSLHGSEERGDDGVSPSQVGLGLALRRYPERFPAIVVFPQCRPGVDWKAAAMQAQILAALNASIAEFHGDPQRQYLTGLSMGGYGTWALAAKYPTRFAAIVVVCGGIQWPTSARIKNEAPYAAVANQVARIPIWVFHGNADRNVFVTESQEMVKLLKARAADVHYTEYAGVAHNSWDRAYAEPELPVWLFAHHR
jgi:predicted peptidase